MSENYRQKCFLGAHFSIAKGLENAIYTARDHGCNAVQIFTKNANTWKEREVTREEINRFQGAMKKTGIRTIASHTSYLINLAASNRKVREKSLKALEAELRRSEKLGVAFVVLHPGAHTGAGENRGIARICKGIRSVLENFSQGSPRLLLETTAGQGTDLGRSFEQLAEIMARVDLAEKLGVCLDTSHVFAAGYDLRTKAACEKTLALFDVVVGLKKLYLLHLNDTKKDLGSNIDRHDHIGRGFIGNEGFRFLMNHPPLLDIPKIIETPKEENGQDMDPVNLDHLRRMVVRFDSGVR